MPQNYVKALAKEHNMSVQQAEAKWDVAKKQAAKQGKAENYAYITSIFKSMMHESRQPSLKEFLSLTEMEDEQTYDRAPAGDRDEFEFGTTDHEELDQIQDDDYSDDDLDLEFDDDFESDDELEFDDGHEHELSDVISPDEMDEFDDEDYSNDYDDVRNYVDDTEEQPRYEGSSYGIIADLLKEGKKPLKLKKAAKSVYHRDYERTKDKPYRKYHPKQHTNEGMWDYIKGAGQETANKARQLAQPIRDIHAAGQQASARNELKETTAKLVRAIQKYRKIKKSLSSTNEGMWDYIKGAGQETANKARQISQPFRDIHAAGQRSSLESDLQKYEMISNKLLNRVIKLMNDIGPDSKGIIDGVLRHASNGIKLAIYGKIKRLQSQQPADYSGPGIKAKTPLQYR